MCNCFAEISALVAPHNQRPAGVRDTRGGPPQLQIALVPIDPSKPGMTVGLLARFCVGCGEEYPSSIARRRAAGETTRHNIDAGVA